MTAEAVEDMHPDLGDAQQTRTPHRRDLKGVEVGRSTNFRHHKAIECAGSHRLGSAPSPRLALALAQG